MANLTICQWFNSNNAYLFITFGIILIVLLVVGVKKTNNTTSLFLIIGLILVIYAFALCSITFCSDVKRWLITNLGYKESINKMYEHLTLITAGLATLVFQYFRVKIRDQQVENQKNQTENQIKQTENIRKDINLKTKTQQDDQFKKAIELLSNSDSTFAARAGAVYLLGALGYESHTHAQSCLDMLAELNRWMGQRLASHPDYFDMIPYLDSRKLWYSRVVTYDEQSLADHYAIINPKKDGEPDIKDLSKEQLQQAKDLSKEQLQQAKESLEAEDLSRLALIKIADIIKKHADDDGTPNKNLPSFNLQGKFLCQINLAGLHLGDRINFSNTRLQGAYLENAQMQGAYLEDAQMQGAYLEDTQMQGANLKGSQMQGAYLEDAQMQGAYLEDAQMQGAYLENAQMQGAYLENAQMQGADLRYAQMQGVNLVFAGMRAANLFNAQMQGAYFSATQMQGATLYNTQMQGARLLGIQVQGAAFNKTNMKGISIAEDLKTFEKRVSPRPHVDRLNSHQTGKLSDEGINPTIKALKNNKNVSPTIIDKIKETLQGRANTVPYLDGIIYGELTQEECDTIINDYNRAMKGVPKK